MTIGSVVVATAVTATAAEPRSSSWFDRAECGQIKAPRSPGFRRVLSNFRSSKTLEIDGPSWNDTLIVGCKISGVNGDGIRIRNARNVTIKDCEIENVSGNGILLRSTGSTSNVSILSNRIRNTGKDGIAATQREAQGIDHPGLVIGWNTISDTGQRGREGLQHSIYSQASDAVIVKNVIQSRREGNAISIRSSGFVACNRISGVSRSGKPGIRYYADHNSGQSRQLVIRNNSIRGAETGVDLMAPPGKNRRRAQALVREIEISGNQSNARSVVKIDKFWLRSPSIRLSQANNSRID